jgi:hypothetical protein
MFQDGDTVLFTPDKTSEIELKTAAKRVGLKQLKCIKQLFVLQRFLISDLDE